MNKKGSEMGMIGKIFLILVLLLTIFSGFNGMLIGLSSNSLVRLITPNSGIAIRAIYVAISLGTLLTAITLFFRVYIQKK
jgi:uncharacterized membrane protein YuzA (DUF378 family)